MVEKKIIKKSSPAAPPEKYFKELAYVFFEVHEKLFKDQDGYPLSPNWRDPQKRGMESKGLKGIITTLREIAEGKKIEWTLEYAKEQFSQFLYKANAKPFLRKNFMCIMLNKYKVDILSSAYNPDFVKLILELWYFEFPNYTVDREKDQAASEIIVGYLKQQYLLKSIEFSKESVTQSMKTIIRTIKYDEFWNKKSLKSIANNFQEVINKIKANGKSGERGQGTSNVGNNSIGPTPTSDSKIEALGKWGLGVNPRNDESKKDI